MQYERPRAAFPLLLNEWDLIGVGVEVGTCRGLFAANLLAFWPGVLHCVDAWSAVPEYGEQYDHESNYQETCDRLKEYEGRYLIFRQTSLDAAQQVQDGALDFVYLDANHAYEAVRDDLNAWYPKVRKGGILAGDDYGIAPEQWVDFGHGRVRFGVKRAVDEWARTHRKNISIDILADWKNMIPGQGEIQARGWWCLV